MSGRSIAFALLAALIVAAGPAAATPPHQDAIWARTCPSALTLDGHLNEAAWAQAESIVVNYAQDCGIPGSGWKSEGGVSPSDPTHAVIKLLVVGNQLWMGAKVYDKSVGGSRDFNRFDGFIMSIKDHTNGLAPKPPAEYTYTWWWPRVHDPQPINELPSFQGKWAIGSDPNHPCPCSDDWRTQEEKNNWDAITIVNGVSNSDTLQDNGYVTEMRFNLTPMGYDVTRADGDIVEWSISVYDNDYFWPLNPALFSSNRVWWQDPWGNDAWYNEVRVYAKPSVTTTSGSLPTFPDEYLVYNGSASPTPVVDGVLNEAIWGVVPGLDIRYGDTALRQTYPGVGQYRAGQYQPTVNGGLAPVRDPADATVKMFVKDTWLYMGFDVRDQYVQYHPSIDRWDGFVVSINDRAVRGGDNQFVGRRLSFQVGPDGNVLPQDYLAGMVQAGTAQIALTLKPGTTVDTLGTDTDTGWFAEMKINLTAVGYPADLGDRLIFLGINLLDGDSFPDPADSYGNRVWWYREWEGSCCAPWGWIDDGNAGVSPSAAVMAAPLLISYPNPSQKTTVQYRLPGAREVTLGVFDPQGRQVEQRSLGMQPAGLLNIPIDGSNWNSGLYFYQLRVVDPASGRLESMPSGRMVVVR